MPSKLRIFLVPNGPVPVEPGLATKRGPSPSSSQTRFHRRGAGGAAAAATKIRHGVALQGDCSASIVSPI